MKVGINYLSNVKEEIYGILKKEGFLDILKFPGEKCTLEELNLFIACVQKYDLEVDIHGLPGVIPAIHDKDFIKNLDWNSINPLLFSCKGAKQYSTHIGLKNGDKVSNYSQEEIETNLQNNIKNFKQEVQHRFHKKVTVGGEMKPGGFQYDPITLTPEFISKTWEKLDFGVFDIAHVELIAEDMGISYEEYRKRLSHTNKITTVHVSENKSPLYPQNPDTHVMISEKKIRRLFVLLQEYKNIENILSEYTFQGYDTMEKEVAIDVIIIKTMIQTKNLEKTLQVYEFLKQEIKKDCSNIQEIINIVKGGYENGTR